jgi:hypothetical protein
MFTVSHVNWLDSIIAGLALGAAWVAYALANQ